MSKTHLHTYWIGGSPCSGKTTIAGRLASSYGCDVYRCDEAYFRHQGLMVPEAQPIFHRLSNATCDELWMRPVATQVSEELALYREEFPFIVDDLAGSRGTYARIVEGAALLPELLAGHGVERRSAIWIVPTEHFQRERYAQRAWRHDVLAGCTDKEQAWNNWMERDASFARFVAREAQVRGFRVLTVDGTQRVEETLRTVETWFGLERPFREPS